MHAHSYTNVYIHILKRSLTQRGKFETVPSEDDDDDDSEEEENEDSTDLVKNGDDSEDEEESMDATVRVKMMDRVR